MWTPRAFLAMVTVLAPLVSVTAQPIVPKVDLGGKEAVIPVTIRFLRAVIPVSINGQGQYDFYFDPGSQGLGIDQSLAETLKLPALAKANVKTSETKGLTRSDMVAVEKLEFGPVTLGACQAVAFPRGTFGLPGQPVGMLTPTLFPGYLITLDYPKKELRLTAGKLPSPDGKEVFAYLDRGSQPAARIDVAGVAADVQFDTNSDGGLTLPRSYIKRVPLMAPPMEAGKVRTSVGEFTYAEATIKGTVKIGRHAIADAPVRFTDAVKRGNIGQAILKDYAITVDIRQRRFKLEQTVVKKE